MKDHQTGKNYSCHYCPKTFSQQRTLNMHERNECPNRPGGKDKSGKAKPAAICPHCQAPMMHRRSLPRHIRRYHPEMREDISFGPGEEEEEEEDQ